MDETLAQDNARLQLKVVNISTHSVDLSDKLLVGMENPKTLGQLITEGLEKQGMNPSQLALKVDVSPTHINNLKNDKYPSATKGGQPRRNPELITKIARQLEIPPPVLLTAAGLIAPEVQKSFDPQKQKFVGFYDELSPAYRRIAVGFLEVVLREQRRSDIGTSESGERAKGKLGKSTKMRQREGGKSRKPERQRQTK